MHTPQSVDKGIMEIDANEESDGSSHGKKENGASLEPVLPEESGEGLPYAPANWPNPGDNWRWKVGKRITTKGHFQDRYLYLPKRLREPGNSTGRKCGFASRLAVERYIKTEFPATNIEEFFASFSWRVPAQKSSLLHGSAKLRRVQGIPPSEEAAEPDSLSDTLCCKARNKMCDSLLEQSENTPVAVMQCDICCSEPKFCRDCCCILCCKTINPSYGGYDYIRCEAMMDENHICGHAAHIDCALRCYMAGSVGGSIGLDSEYYCRRCDARTDLVSHVTKLPQICESLNSRDDIEKVLNLGICILRGSEKTNARELSKRIEAAIAKLKCGTALEEIWKEDDNSSVMSIDASCNGNAAPQVTGYQEPSEVRTSPEMISDYQKSQKLEEEIDRVLQELRKSQESEYRRAEESLHAQKNYLCDLYQQLEKEKSDLARCTSTDPDALLSTISSRVKQIKREAKKLKDMEEIAKGFGKTSRAILIDHFCMEIDE